MMSHIVKEYLEMYRRYAIERVDNKEWYRKANETELMIDALSEIMWYGDLTKKQVTGE